MMCRSKGLQSAGLMSLMLTGCGVEGTWVTRSVQPPEAQKHFDLACATFKSDMSFEATAKEGDKTVKARGTYDYDPWRRQLTLKTGGKELNYKASVWWMKELRVQKKMPDGKLITSTMDKRDKCPEPVVCPLCAKCPTCSRKLNTGG